MVQDFFHQRYSGGVGPLPMNTASRWPGPLLFIQFTVLMEITAPVAMWWKLYNMLERNMKAPGGCGSQKMDPFKGIQISAIRLHTQNLHPAKLTWNLKMEVDGRWCSFWGHFQVHFPVGVGVFLWRNAGLEAEFPKLIGFLEGCSG